MIKGKIPVTWAEQNYTGLPWFENDRHEEKFNAVVDTTNYNVGVSMCFQEQLLGVFYDAVKDLPLTKKVVAVNKLAPGKVLPYHTDKYTSYITRNQIKKEQVQDIQRFIVFLHDQKAGHQLWIRDQICTGSAGSYFGWGYGVEHMAANLGNEDRYILQVTGLKC
tara:strand:- start:10419 stop:10910 length:492 start_codon:yes stop_codon:yes gene_type:complete